MGAYQSCLTDEAVKRNKIDFVINGQQCSVDTDKDGINTRSVLVDFIRDKAGLKGTKYMCREGGCGACVVSVKSKDPNTGKDVTRAVNSCLVPVFSADGWNITTVEGTGNKSDGSNKIQDQVVKFGATQCGYCTPGMVMNFYSLSQANPAFKAKDVEDSFDGNICRCTGYRPILDAFKSMAGDASEELRRKTAEINLSDKCPCPSEGGCCRENVDVQEDLEYDNCLTGSKIYLKLNSGDEWIRATNLTTLFDAMQHFASSGTRYRVIAGNTGSGVYKNDGPYNGHIDINGVPELKQSIIGASGVEIGAGITLTEAIQVLQKASELDGYFYTSQMSRHIKRVANTPVRNAATLGGNLMLKHMHREFPSDIFMLLETVGAKLKIGTSATMSREYSLMEFTDTDMTGKIIISIRLPPYKGGNYYFKSFKVSRRYQNSHAYVNAGFLMKVDPKRNYSIRDKPTLVFGGIHPDFVHAIGTEIFFVGKFLNLKTLRGSMESLEKEIQPSDEPRDAHPTYRRKLAQVLLYKFMLEIMGDSVKPSLKSGGQEIERSLMYGKQDFDSDQSQWPLYQPISKIEAKVQASGAAEYINDICPRFGELSGAFVVTTVANAKLQKIVATEALMMAGVVAFIQAKDVPGLNNAAIFYPEPEELFVTENVRYAGQAVGLILAESRDIAIEAAKKVSLTYTNVEKPILDIKESLHNAKEQGKLQECIMEIKKSSVESITAAHNIRGEMQIGSQYHFHMETQTCLCVPKEDGMDVYSATQFQNSVQTIVATILGVPAHNITVTVRRLGGGFGAKISKSTQIAAACAVGAHVTKRPVRIVLDLETNMKMIGKRLPYLAKYEAGVDNSGNILNLKCEIFCDPGCVGNEETSLFAMLCLQNCYRASGWEAIPGKAITNKHPNTFCRAPGSTQGIAIIESIVEHIAFTLKLDPLQVRMTNFIKDGDPLLAIPGMKFQGENPLPKMIEDLKSSSEYNDRKTFIDNFNQANRWKKRGLSVVPMRYPNHYPEFILRYPVYLAVYASDGTVNVSHGGIEMGQGINTKCAQVVAHTLKIPIEKVKVQPTNTLLSPNAGITGGAVTSELVCHAAVESCKKLLAKMEPVRATLENPSWEQLVGACYGKHVLLTSHHQDGPTDVKPYDIWGTTLTEVEIDVLTGEYKIVRVDLFEDAGKSLSPNVDIGQIEGAFVMGLGMWTTEKLIYDRNTGELLTCNTWDYKPPLPRDIPEDFRVTMLRNRENPFGVLSSKATGESPLTMSVSVLFALRYAINSARVNAGNTDWYQVDSPLTPEDIQRLSLTSKEQFEI